VLPLIHFKQMVLNMSKKTPNLGISVGWMDLGEKIGHRCTILTLEIEKNQKKLIKQLIDKSKELENKGKINYLYYNIEKHPDQFAMRIGFSEVDTIRPILAKLNNVPLVKDFSEALTKDKTSIHEILKDAKNMINKNLGFIR